MWMPCPKCGRKCNVSHKRLTFCPRCGSPVQMSGGAWALVSIIGAIIALLAYLAMNGKLPN